MTRMLVFLLCLLGVALIGVVKTSAHSFYSFECCGDFDCAPVKSENVKEVSGGFLFTIPPRSHPMAKDWKEPRQFFVPYKEAKASPDGEYHLCIVQGAAKCAWAPMGAS